MNKIFLIIQREYLTRVKKRTFIVMTLIGPLLMATLFIGPIYLASMENKQKNILVVDETHIFPETCPPIRNIHSCTDPGQIPAFSIQIQLYVHPSIHVPTTCSIYNTRWYYLYSEERRRSYH